MNQRKPMTSRQALLRLRDLCDRGEYCAGELREKMARWKIPVADRDKIIALLENAGLVDDHRFACAFVHTKAMNSHWGRVKIKLHLMRKKVDAAIIADALDTLDEEDYERCLSSVLSAKKRQLGDEADTYDGRTKIFRHGVSRGYEPGLVARMIREGEY